MLCETSQAIRNDYAPFDLASGILEASAMKIHFTMSNGSKYTLSNKVYGGDGPFTSRVEVSSQLSLATQKLAYFTSDDGTILFTNQIATARIEQ